MLEKHGLFCLLLCAAACGANEFNEAVHAEEVSDAQSALTFTNLTLQNGWTNAPFSTASAAVALDNGFVQFRGAIATTSNNPNPFTLPSSYRPNSNVYLPLNLCNATKGRLTITPAGSVTVSAEGGAFSNAQCFTSLEGVSFALNTTGFTALTLQNGWTNAPFATRNAAVKKVAGVVRLAGAIKTTGANAAPFQIPLDFFPSRDVYLPLDLCGGTKGRLHIDLSGNVSVSAEGGVFANAQCFTSLEGVTYAQDPSSPGNYTCMPSLQNGWMPAPFNTRNICMKTENGIVRLLGATNTAGTNPVPLTLPAAFRPATDVYVLTDMCNGAQGRVRIQPTGVVTVQPKGALNNATCFTSFDGVAFVP